MKKYLLLALLWVFWLLNVQDAFWTVAPIYPTCHQKVCSMITDTNIVDWYKLISVSWFSWYVNEVKPFTCLKWFIFLVPEDLDLETVKTKEIRMTGDDSHFKERYDYNRSYYWSKYPRELDNVDSKEIWKLKDIYSYYCVSVKPSHVFNLYEIWTGENWELWLINYYTLSYDMKWVYYVLWWIILICWGIYCFIRLIVKHNKHEEK